MRLSLLYFSIIAYTIAARGQLNDFASINFHKADSIADHHHGRDLSNLPLLSYDLTHSLSTEVEKFRSIYTWVSKNVENDYLSYLRNKRKRNHLINDSSKLAEWNKSFQKQVFEKLLEEHKTICTGYAYLVKELTLFADIRCRIIHGYARTASSNVEALGIPNHSWNAVQLKGKWYMCDPTWSSGNIYPFGKVSTFVHEYNDGYFLAKPEFFFKNHYPLDSNWLLTEEDLTVNEFLKAPITYDKAFKHRLYPMEPKTMHNQLVKGDSLVFKLETLNKIEADKIYVELNSGSHERIAELDVISYDNNILILNHTFNNIGYFDIHLKIGEDLLATYTAAVSRK